MFVHRVQLALNSSIGIVLEMLAVGLVGLILFYIILWAISKKIDKNKQYFKIQEKSCFDLSFIGEAKYSFWGREKLVKKPDGLFGVSIIPFPNLTDKLAKDRFSDFHSLLAQSEKGCFGKNFNLYFPTSYVAVEDTYVLPTEGRAYITLNEYTKDNTIPWPKAEALLYDLAHTLKALHSLKTKDGESLYHGFLMPTNIYLCTNLLKSITHWVIGEVGFAYSIGAKKAHQWSRDISKVKKFDSKTLEDIKTFWPMLAPEIRNSALHTKVSYLSDFYNFAALAVYVFTNKVYSDPKEIDWDKVPFKWQKFLKSCLEENLENRPQDFLILQDYLQDPELMLLLENEEKKEILPPTRKKEIETSEIQDAFKKVRKEQPSLMDANTNLDNGDYQSAIALYSEHLESKFFLDAHIGLAICYHYLNDPKQSQYHYQKVKEKAPLKLKEFHQKIAFKI